MAIKVEIKGNQLVVTDLSIPPLRLISVTRDKVMPYRDVDTDVFSFFWNAPVVNNSSASRLMKLGLVDTPGTTPEKVGQVDFPFADLVDQNGVPFASADELDLFLCVNLGSLEPAVLPTPPTGIEGFFLSSKGDFGTGGGWGDAGFIANVPVILFAKNATEKEVTMFYAINRAVFDDIDPIVQFLPFSVAAPVVTTGDAVRWQLEATYIAEGELATMVPDETLLVTQILTFLTVDTRQPILEFTLDRTLIENGDSITLVLSRIGGDAADNYNDDIGVGQAGIALEVTAFNP